MDLTTIAATIAPDILDTFQNQVLWALVVGIFIAFILGFAMGANDVANTFGTSVGSNVLSLKKAYVLAVIFEALGALLVGYNVIDTVRKSVISIEMYSDTPKVLLIGQVAILAGCSSWLLIATMANMPVSATHSIVGATVGFGLVMKGTEGVKWPMVIDIVMSWVISPVLSGIASCLLYMIVDFAVLRRKNPVRCGLITLPIFYWFCIAFNVFIVSYQGSKLLKMQDIPLWLCLVLSAVIATIGSALVHFLLIPKLKIWIQDDNNCTSMDDKTKSNITTVNQNSACDTPKISIEPKSVKECKRGIQSGTNPSLLKRIKSFIRWLHPSEKRLLNPAVMKVFGSIQAFTACFAGFAHGSNDVGNSIAPLVAMISIYKSMSVSQKDDTPIYVLVFGVVSICVGLVVLGKRVIYTVGKKMSKINPTSGFAIEFGAALTTLVASKKGLPVSTTHSLVGSVVAVGLLVSPENVKWRIFREVAIAWIVTVPISGLISACVMLLLKLTL